jgi:hypothetical protein
MICPDIAIFGRLGSVLREPSPDYIQGWRAKAMCSAGFDTIPLETKRNEYLSVLNPCLRKILCSATGITAAKALVAAPAAARRFLPKLVRFGTISGDCILDRLGGQHQGLNRQYRLTDRLSLPKSSCPCTFLLLSRPATIDATSLCIEVRPCFGGVVDNFCPLAPDLIIISPTGLPRRTLKMMFSSRPPHTKFTCES